MTVSESKKIRDSFKSFLEKMKAFDGEVPEELAEDALELAEEVKDATSVCEDEEKEEVKDEETNVLEVTKDEDIDKKIEDGINRALMKAGIIRDKSMDALDELLKETETEDEEPDEDKAEDEDNEEKVTVDPEKINDSAASVREFIRSVKPIVASVKDAKIRDNLSRKIADYARTQLGVSKGASQYGSVVEIVNQNQMAKAADAKSTVAISDADYGMEIAKKFNPHYKEGV